MFLKIVFDQFCLDRNIALYPNNSLKHENCYLTSFELLITFTFENYRIRKTMKC